MSVEVKKAIAINCWDVLVNGIPIERFDRKKDANTKADAIRKEYGV